MNICDIIEMIKLGEGWVVEFKEIFLKPSHLAVLIILNRQVLVGD